ncbi:ovarian cancer G-protein coupled receptor 1-like [Acipenser ruthenus]|uniref:ovarian cancer G-protein coupled receptor 1-like n=1 Tax=Acipenser ruthenus TaxID=7906 RepID=UPI00145BB4C4|nr:ovarian cancer G-protein coupled receptor 1-like [Acipenser ruthenus]
MTVPLAVDFDSPGDFAIFILNILIATTIVIVAGSVVIAILCTKSLRTENRFIFMLNTSISDTISGFAWYYTGLFDVQEYYPRRNTTLGILNSCVGVNVFTVLFAQIDRYLAIGHPYVYSRYITRSVIIGICICCWVYVYLTVLVNNVVSLEAATEHSAYGTLAFQLIITFTMLGLNLKLYLIAKYQLSRDPPGPETDRKKASLRLIIVVAFSFLAFWTPAFVNTILRNMKSPYAYICINNGTDPFVVLSEVNPISTPALYIMGSSALKEAVLRTVCRVFRKCKRR